MEIITIITVIGAITIALFVAEGAAVFMAGIVATLFVIASAIRASRKK
jgi:hypothetical protein